MVVAIGASAGGLDAVRGLISGLAPLSGIAYILVQHLDPDHPSMLADLLAADTPFPVVEATDNMPLLADRLHVIPAGSRIAVSGHMLRLSPATKDQGPRLPIDFLLCSLAAERDLQVVAIILSGNGADGSAGVRSVHDAGGHVMVQDPQEASHSSMPLAAIATECADAVLPLASMGAAIMSLREHLPLPLPAQDENADWIAPVLARLKHGGHDFSGYKVGTMQRRIERRARMSGQGRDALSNYVARLESDPDELQALASDLLINVTEFFRDAAVFDILAENIIPDLVAKHDDKAPIRLWCAGCSTGQEAWSLAMLILEEIARSRPSLKLQIFATDLDAEAIDAARLGAYPSSIAGDIADERLRRWFIATDQGYKVGPALQSSVVFAVHDLLVDPPFSRIDMIACRNLLIYLHPPAQARAINLFQFSLCPGGLLLLGKAEAVTEQGSAVAAAFTLVSREAHLYRRSNCRRAVLGTAGVGSPAPFQGKLLPAPPWSLPALPSARLEALEAELASIRSLFSNLDRRPDSADAELMALHADTLSRNQEYQTTNEELITSQEELQSLNEELVALNGQLQETIDRQRVTSNDLQNILYSTDVATIFLDLDGNIRFFTPATRLLFNMLPGDIGRPFADLAPLTPDQDLLSDITAVSKELQPIEREVESADGLCFCRRVLPYRAMDQNVEGVIITYTDISDRKRASRAMLDAREVAEAANLAKSRFLAAASHDLRQPLQALGITQELLARIASDPESHELLARFDQMLGSMTSMLDSLLDINRIEAGAVDVAPTVFALDTLLSETVQGLAVQASITGLKLRHVPTGHHIMSDRRLLAGMVRNLVANALKYTLVGGVVIGARRRGAEVRIEIWDSGIGIAADKLEAVFQPYHQIGPALVDRSRGLGLGLSIVRSLGEMLDHDVSVKSRPGRGTTFAITVPMADRAASADTQLADDPAQAHSGQVPIHAGKEAGGAGQKAGGAGNKARAANILLVDDDPEILDLLGRLLRDDGHTVMLAIDEAQALELLERHTPDLIISDLLLADNRDGLEMALAMQLTLRQALGRLVPVIMLSGDISIDTLVRLAANDVVQLSKPVRPSELQAAIAHAVQPKDEPQSGVTGQQRLVHVIDDDPLLLKELGVLLENAGLPCRLHDSSETFRADWQPDQAGCLLIDACLPGESGTDLMLSLQRDGKLPPSIMITGQGDVRMAVMAMKAGALDFIEKPASGDLIIDRIRRALAKSIGTAAVDVQQDAAAVRLATLTGRQRAVMTMVLAGQPSKNIAADLKISQRTVEHHRAQIMRRTGCRSLPELARLVMLADPRFLSPT